MDSSSSTTSRRGIGTSDFSSLPSHICLNLPETFLSVPNRFCFTGPTKGNNFTQPQYAAGHPLFRQKSKYCFNGQIASHRPVISSGQARRPEQIPKEMKSCICEGSALVVLIVGLPH